MDDDNIELTLPNNRIEQRCRWPLVVFVSLNLLTGLIVAALFIPEAYNDAVDRGLCRKQLSQVDDAFRTIAVLWAAGVGIAAAVWVGLKCLDPTKIGSMLLNMEITVIGTIALTWAVVFVAGVFASHCGTNYQSQIWAASFFLAASLLSWVCCGRKTP